MLTPPQYHKAVADFKMALDICLPLLSAEASKDVKHYLDHAEIEIAYESLGMSLKAENVSIPQQAKEILYPLGIILNVNSESVLSGNFWEEVAPLLKP